MCSLSCVTANRGKGSKCKTKSFQEMPGKGNEDNCKVYRIKEKQHFEGQVLSWQNDWLSSVASSLAAPCPNVFSRRLASQTREAHLAWELAREQGQLS